jgi:hypothetical protein
MKYKMAEGLVKWCIVWTGIVADSADSPTLPPTPSTTLIVIPYPNGRHPINLVRRGRGEEEGDGQNE